MTTNKTNHLSSALTSDYLSVCKRSREQEQSESLAASNNWAHVDKAQVHADWDMLYKELAPLIASGALADASEVQGLVAKHHAIISRFYEPSREGYIGLGLFYQEDPSMREFHNTYHPLLADYLKDAICVYALDRL
jgi:hypothetical protein